MMIFAQEYFFTIPAAFCFFVFILSFFLGEGFSHVISRKKDFSKNNFVITENFRKNFEIGLIAMGIMSLIGSVLYLLTFASYFGGIMPLLTAGWAIRGALNEGEIIIPLYIKLLLFPGYSNVILALIYYIIFSKFKWYLVLPFIALFIMGSAQAGRAGFMLILFELYISVLFAIFYINAQNGKKIKNEIGLIKKSILLISVVFVVFVGGDMLRRQTLDFSMESAEVFRQYLFGGISAFSTFFKNREFSEISYGFGRYSFSALYAALGIAKNEFGVYTEYLRISSKDYTLVTNIYTAFRQLIDDFGVIGAAFIMFCFGMLSNYYYNFAIKGNIKSIAVSIVIYTIIFHSTLLSITVHNSILLTLVLPNLVLSLFLIKLKS